MKESKNAITIRSSAAEYLTYAAAVGDSLESIEMRYEDENIWLTQRMMAELYKFYSLDAIIAVGYRVNSVRATQFRQWATKVLSTFSKRAFLFMISLLQTQNTLRQ